MVPHCKSQVRFTRSCAIIIEAGFARLVDLYEGDMQMVAPLKHLRYFFGLAVLVGALLAACGKGSVPSPVAPINTPIGNGRVGTWPDPPNVPANWNNLGFFQGSLDDISIYDRAFTTEQIMALYTEGGWGK
jgi:hypothetical protein